MSMSALGIDLKDGLGSVSVSVSCATSSGSSEDQAQLGVFRGIGDAKIIPQPRSLCPGSRVVITNTSPRHPRFSGASLDSPGKLEDGRSECHPLPLLSSSPEEMTSNDEIVDLNEEIVDDPNSDRKSDRKKDPEEDPKDDMEGENQIVLENEEEKDSDLKIKEAQAPKKVQTLKRRINELEETLAEKIRTRMRLDNITEVLEERNRHLQNQIRLYNINKGLEERSRRLQNQIDKVEDAFRVSYERLLTQIEDYPLEGGQDAPIDRSVLIKMIEEAELSWCRLCDD